MRSLTLSDHGDAAVVVPFSRLRYPADDQAQLRGIRFGGAEIRKSVHFRSCIQIAAGRAVEEIDYYAWTREKILRFGPSFEAFMYSSEKGCGLTADEHEVATQIAGDGARWDYIAGRATEAFIRLFRSIEAGWDPGQGKNDIAFVQLRDGTYTVTEGRHRVCILVYLSERRGISAFRTSRRNVRRARPFSGVLAAVRIWLRAARRPS